MLEDVACGRIRYECSEQPIVQLICHCRDCQRASGSAFAALLAVPSDRLKFSESELKYHSIKADSGRTMQRGFCSECGSPVSGRRPETPLVEFLQAASLDDPSKFHPSCEVWVSRADPWHPFMPPHRSSSKVPPRTRLPPSGVWQCYAPGWYFGLKKKRQGDRACPPLSMISGGPLPHICS